MKTLLTCSALALLLIGASALGKDQVGEKPWRVDAPIGPTRTTAFETEAGTSDNTRILIYLSPMAE